MSALTPLLLLVGACAVLSSVHAVLRSKPPALAGKRTEEVADLKASTVASTLEEGMMMEER